MRTRGIEVLLIARSPTFTIPAYRSVVVTMDLKEKDNDTMPHKIIQPALFSLEMKSAVKHLVLPSE